MMIFTVILIVIINIEKCLTDLSFLNKIKRIITDRDVKDKNIKGTFKTTIYLGSSAKVSCFGKKYQIPSFRHLTWYHLGKRISSSDRYRIDKLGILTIYDVSVEDSGEFICRVNSESGTHKFKHDVTVVQIPSKSLHVHFVYAVRLCTSKSEELATHFVQSKVEGQICLEKECELSYIHSTCYYEQFANPRIKVTVPILLFGIPNGSCDVICSREKQENLKQEIKDKVISVVMHGPRLKIREEPQEISVSYLETDEDSICNPGFEMKGTISRSLCIPCTPGHFLEKGYCIPCHLNHYNGKYAASECRSCFGSRVTRSRGTVTEEDCYLADPDVLWILFAIIIITAPFTLLCFCWSVIKFLEETALGRCLNSVCLFMTCNCKVFKRKGGSNSIEGEDGNYTGHSQKARKSVHETGDNLKQPFDVVSSGRKPGSSGSFVIPSVRHSTGTDFFYRQQQPVTKSRQQQPVTKSAVPPPPALPTDSMMKQATRSMAYNAVTRDNNPGKKNRDETELKEISHSPVKDAKFSSKIRDDLPLYSDRFLKNKPMYNAIMKSK